MLDDVGRALRDARTALSHKDNAKAAEPCRPLQALCRFRPTAPTRSTAGGAAADLKLAQATHDRMAALARKLAATAVIKAMAPAALRCLLEPTA